jgi:hypothetical protein
MPRQSHAENPFNETAKTMEEIVRRSVGERYPGHSRMQRPLLATGRQTSWSTTRLGAG